MQTPRPHTRAPVVAVVGHIDHGKSTLLDYIRKTNVVAGEAGGITQRLSAYEVLHAPKGKEARPITFLDTPGHAAFQTMRSRGLEVADVAILVVSAEEGVKPQTLEALRLIREVGIPFIVAINKIDKPSAQIDRTKSSLIENEVYLEGLGGDVPWVGISAKRGDGIEELLDLILLAADLEGLTYDPSLPAKGVVIESHVDTRKGISATLVVQEGVLVSGSFVVAGESFAPLRIMQNVLGKSVREVPAGSPVVVVGFSSLPVAGVPFTVVKTKAEAREACERASADSARKPSKLFDPNEETKPYLPLIIKADVAGSLDAIEHELAKIKTERLDIRVIERGVGPVTESDVKLVSGGKIPGIVLGFNVEADARARELSERDGITIALFNIIYKLAEWLAGEIPSRTPKVETEVMRASAKVLKIFSEGKEGFLLGGRVEEGTLEKGAQVKLMRGAEELGRGFIGSMQSGKSPVSSVAAVAEFGAMVKISSTPAPGDKLVAFERTLL